MKSDLTEIAFILDRSGSMEPMTEAAISGFNSFLHDQQEAEGEARLTLMLFDDQFLLPVESAPVSEVADLTAKTYTARGSTALLDAIGRTVEKLHRRIRKMPKSQQPGQVLVAIFTDGCENSSLEYDWKSISALIRERREKDGWEFVFLAANQDAIATASQISIGAHDSATVSFSKEGIRGCTAALSSRTMRIRLKQAKSQSMSELVEQHEAPVPPKPPKPKNLDP